MRFALLFIAALTVIADEQFSREQWEASPEACFMTQEERREWEIIRTDADARRFIHAFRARRGSDFPAEVQRRAAIVDERLALGEVKASATLRGKIVMLLGAPAELRVQHTPTATVGNVNHPLATRRGGHAGDRPPQANMIGNGAGWVDYTFQYAPNPALGIAEDGWTVVIEANAASGKDRLKYRRDRKMLDAILDAAARRMLR